MPPTRASTRKSESLNRVVLNLPLRTLTGSGNDRVAVVHAPVSLEISAVQTLVEHDNRVDAERCPGQHEGVQAPVEQRLIGSPALVNVRLHTMRRLKLLHDGAPRALIYELICGFVPGLEATSSTRPHGPDILLFGMGSPRASPHIAIRVGRGPDEPR